MRKTVRSLWLAAAAAFVLGSLGAGQPAAAQDEVKREITNIAGDLYRFQNQFHFSVFLVTPEGVIATDPINAAAAEWLEAEIRERFGQEIRYLVLSHDHADHSRPAARSSPTPPPWWHTRTPSAPSSASSARRRCRRSPSTTA
jgi:glyoxylase-like metal-dependent hydrolase (beta-lactamase superfamily II)